MIEQQKAIYCCNEIRWGEIQAQSDHGPPSRLAWVVALLFVAAVTVRAWALGSYGINNDENLWHIRSAEFVKSLLGPFAPGDIAVPKDFGDHINLAVNLLEGSRRVISREYPFTAHIDTVHPGTPISFLMGLSHILLARGSSSWSLNWLSVIAASRLPNVIVGASIVFVFFYLGKALVGWRAALFAAAFGAFEPFLVGYSREAQLDMSATVFIAGSLLCYFNARCGSGKQRQLAIFGGIFGGLALATNPYAVYIFPALLAARLLWQPRREEKTGGKLLSRALLPDETDVFYALSWALTFVLVYPNIWPNPILGVREWFRLVNEMPHLQTGSALKHFAFLIHGPIHVLPWTLLLGLFGGYMGIKTRDRAVVAILAWLGSYLLFLSVLAGDISLKRMLFLLPALVLLAGYGLDRIIRRMESRNRKPNPGMAYPAAISLLVVAGLAVNIWWWPYPDLFTWPWLPDPQKWSPPTEVSVGEGMYHAVEYIHQSDGEKARIACLSGANNAAYFHDSSLVHNAPSTLQELKDLNCDWLVVLPKYVYRVPPVNEVIRFAKDNRPTHMTWHHQIETTRMFDLREFGLSGSPAKANVVNGMK
ncbi:glycosyltransferase family 39 protein [Candidatus Poribacteria bacterium]|nr:glycosyltransferase family 39 protein [Candidatus Poribacteria bacterium]